MTFEQQLATICKKAAFKCKQGENLKEVEARPFYWQRQQLLAAEGRTHADLAEWIAT